MTRYALAVVYLLLMPVLLVAGLLRWAVAAMLGLR